MKLLVTGTRQLESADDRRTVRKAIVDLIHEHQPEVIIHGAAAGVDSYVAATAATLDVPTDAHPAKWREHNSCRCPETAAYCREAGSRRNQEMLELKPDLVVAFPGPRSRGTWDMVRRAEVAGIEVQINYLTGNPK